MPTRPAKHQPGPRCAKKHLPTQARRIRSSSRWNVVRDLYRGKNPLCEKCGKFAKHVHHVLPLETHPHLAFHLENLMSLCEPCHVLEHGGHTVEQAIDDMRETR